MIWYFIGMLSGMITLLLAVAAGSNLLVGRRFAMNPPSDQDVVVDPLKTHFHSSVDQCVVN